MGASQSAEDSDTEVEEGLEEVDQQDEELEQEPEIRPFNYPQSPLEPQESDTLLPVPEPLELSETDPQLPELAEDLDLATNGHLVESGSIMQASEKPAPLDIPDEQYSVLSNSTEHESTSGGPQEMSALQPGHAPWDSADFAAGAVPFKPPESPGLGLGTSFVSMSPLPPHMLSPSAPASGLSSPSFEDVTTEVYIIRHAEATNNVSNLIGGRSPTATLTPKGRRQAALLGRFLLEYYNIQFDAIYSSPLERARATAVSVCQEMGIPEETIILESNLQELSQGEWEGRLRSDIYVPGMAARMNAAQPDFRAPGGESQRQVEFRMVEFFNNLAHQARHLGATQRSRQSKGGAFSPNPSLGEGGGFNLSVGVPFASHQSEPMANRNGIGSGSDLDNGNNSGGTITNRFRSDGIVRFAVFSHGTAIKCLLRGILGSEPQMTYKITIDNTSVTVLKHMPSKGWHLQKVNDTAHFILARGQ